MSIYTFFNISSLLIPNFSNSVIASFIIFIFSSIFFSITAFIFSVTKVPFVDIVTIAPLFSNSSYAFFTVLGFIPSEEASSLIDGICS